MKIGKRKSLLLKAAISLCARMCENEASLLPMSRLLASMWKLYNNASPALEIDRVLEHKEADSAKGTRNKPVLCFIGNSGCGKDFVARCWSDRYDIKSISTSSYLVDAIVWLARSSLVESFEDNFLAKYWAAVPMCRKGLWGSDYEIALAETRKRPEAWKKGGENYEHAIEKLTGIRHQFSKFLMNIGIAMTEEDPSLLIRRSLMDGAGLFTGIRRRREFIGAKRLGFFDLSIWIKREGADEDFTLDITEEDCDLTYHNKETFSEEMQQNGGATTAVSKNVLELVSTEWDFSPFSS